MIPPLPLRPGSMYRFGGTVYAISALEDDGNVRLACPVRRDLVVTLSVAELVRMRMTGEARLAGEPEVEAGKTKVRPFDSFAKEQRDKIARRVAYVNATRPLWPIGPLNPLLKEVVEAVAMRRGESEPPSTHTVYRWLSRFAKSNDTSVFMLDAGYRSQRKPRIEQKDKAVLQGHIEALLSNRPGESLWAITDLALALTARDLGHSTFIDKRGQERDVAETVAVAESAFEAKAKGLPKAPRKRRGIRKTTESKK